jgi:hypothetical protein
VFKTFAKEDASFKKTLRCCPARCTRPAGPRQARRRAHVLGPTLHKLEPFARALGPANEATRKLSEKTAPIIKNEIRPFAREILPVVNELGPDDGRNLSKALPKLATSFSVLNEFFNELAYNPGPSKGGFLFFLDWGNHDLNSVLSTAESHGVARAWPRVLQLQDPEPPEARRGSQPDGEPAGQPAQAPDQGRMHQRRGIPVKAAKRAVAPTSEGSPSGGPFSGLGQQPFGGKG